MKNIQILFDNQPADYGDFSIEFEFINPMFSDSKMNTEYTFSFSLPFSPGNKKRFSHSNRIDVQKKHSYDFKLIVQGSTLMSGIAKVTSDTGGKAFSVTVISDGIDFAQRCTDKLLKDIPMDSVVLYDEETATANERLDAWHNEQFLRMFLEAPTEGSHKYPQIYTAGYDGSYGEQNMLHRRNQFVVNAMAEGDFLSSWGVLDVDLNSPQDQWWPFTVSPCPRIIYLLQKIFDFFGIRIATGDLLQDVELQQLVTFSGVVLDDNKSYSTLGPGSTPYKLNVHGGSFRLQDFVPDVNVMSIFNMLNEAYGAMVIVSKGKVHFRTYKEILSRKPVNMSRYFTSELNSELSDGSSPHVFYEAAEENDLKKIFLPIWDYAVTGGNDFQLDHSGRSVFENPEDVNQEFPITHYPMKSNFFVTEGYDQDRAQYLAGTDLTRRGFGEFMPRFIFPFGIQSFGTANGDKRQERLNIGYYRGRFDTARKYLDGDGEPHEETYITCWPYSWDKTTWDTRNMTTGFEHFFGTSLYLAENNGTYDNWLEYYFKLFDNADSITRTMQLAPHQLEKMREFESIKHIIEDRRGNIVGYLAKISGTITNQGLEPVSCNFKVPRRVLSRGDYNDDFSSDFS